MAALQISAKTRTVLGKKVKSLRSEGWIPAELFGRGEKNRHLSLPEKEFVKVFKKAGEHTVVDAVTENGEKIPVLITSAERHPISQKFLSVDLHQIRMDEKIHAKIPVELVGEAPAI